MKEVEIRIGSGAKAPRFAAVLFGMGQTLVIAAGLGSGLIRLYRAEFLR